MSRNVSSNVRASSPWAQLHVISGGEIIRFIDIYSARTTFGRSLDADIRLFCGTGRVSFALTVDGDEIFVENTGMSPQDLQVGNDRTAVHTRERIYNGNVVYVCGYMHGFCRFRGSPLPTGPQCEAPAVPSANTIEEKDQAAYISEKVAPRQQHEDIDGDQGTTCSVLEGDSRCPSCSGESCTLDAAVQTDFCEQSPAEGQQAVGEEQRQGARNPKAIPGSGELPYFAPHWAEKVCYGCGQAGHIKAFCPSSATRRPWTEEAAHGASDRGGDRGVESKGRVDTNAQGKNGKGKKGGSTCTTCASSDHGSYLPPPDCPPVSKPAVKAVQRHSNPPMRARAAVSSKGPIVISEPTTKQGVLVNGTWHHTGRLRTRPRRVKGTYVAKGRPVVEGVRQVTVRVGGPIQHAATSAPSPLGLSKPSPAAAPPMLKPRAHGPADVGHANSFAARRPVHPRTRSPPFVGAVQPIQYILLSQPPWLTRINPKQLRAVGIACACAGTCGKVVRDRGASRRPRGCSLRDAC